MLLHATCVAINGRAVLLTGPSGHGKSDLALRLIEGGASLVSDDQTFLTNEKGVLMAAPPSALAGLLEIRHVGLFRVPFLPVAPVALAVDLVRDEGVLDRLPEKEAVSFLDLPVRRLRLASFAGSTPAKIRAALMFGEVDD